MRLQSAPQRRRLMTRGLGENTGFADVIDACSLRRDQAFRPLAIRAQPVAPAVAMIRAVAQAGVGAGPHPNSSSRYGVTCLRSLCGRGAACARNSAAGQWSVAGRRRPVRRLSCHCAGRQMFKKGASWEPDCFAGDFEPKNTW
jgi:hypothetical protein